METKAVRKIVAKLGRSGLSVKQILKKIRSDGVIREDGGPLNYYFIWSTLKKKRLPTYSRKKKLASKVREMKYLIIVRRVK